MAYKKLSDNSFDFLSAWNGLDIFSIDPPRVVRQENQAQVPSEPRCGWTRKIIIK